MTRQNAVGAASIAEPAPEVFARAFERAASGLAIFDVHTMTLRWSNSHFETWIRRLGRNAALQGAPLEDLIPGAGPTGLEGIFRRVAATGESYQHPNIATATIDGDHQRWTWMVSACDGPGGFCDASEATALLLQVVELPAEAGQCSPDVPLQSIRSESVDLLLNSVGDAVTITDRDGVVRFWNDAATRIFGWRPDEIIGRPLSDRVPEDARPAMIEAITKIARGEEFVGEWQDYRKDGTQIWIDATVRPMRDHNDRIVGILGVSRDVTHRKSSEDRSRLMRRELSHRIKNLVALIQSIATQTLRRASSMDDFESRFAGRMRALSRSHGVLGDNQVDNPSLRRLLDEALRPYRAANDSQTVVLAGPDVRCWPEAAAMLSMVFHELATNASKYGSLSDVSGQVSVDWSIDSGEDEPALRLVWKESGGPAVTPPAQLGFGTQLIEQGVAHDLRGRAQILYEASGVCCTMLIPWKVDCIGHGSPISERLDPS